MKVNEKLSMLLMLEKSKMSKDGKAPITIRLTIDCKRAEISLGQKYPPNSGTRMLEWQKEVPNRPES